MEVLESADVFRAECVGWAVRHFRNRRGFDCFMAEDCFQDALVELWKYERGTRLSDVDVKRYVYMCMRDCCVKYLKMRRRGVRGGGRDCHFGELRDGRSAVTLIAGRSADVVEGDLVAGYVALLPRRDRAIMRAWMHAILSGSDSQDALAEACRKTGRFIGEVVEVVRRCRLLLRTKL